MSKHLSCAGKILNLETPCVMGILNVTPDSFYDGGWYNTQSKAVERAAQMISEGATIIDIGGESTRPGASGSPTEQEELDRVIPIVESVSQALDTIISIDTSSPKVMEAAVNAGAGIINDVRALQKPNAIEVAAKMDVPVILMHSLIEQSTEIPTYNDLLSDISDYLLERANLCIEAGIKQEQIILDPGFGGGMFGKTPQQNLLLAKDFKIIRDLGYPVLVGVSRKGFLGKITDREIGNRLSAALGIQSTLLEKGASIIRTHDVAASLDAIKILDAMINS